MSHSSPARELSIRESAERKNLSETTIRRMIARGELAAYKYGSAIRIRVEDLDAAGRRIPTANS